MQYMVAVGYLQLGLEFFGPFSSVQEASDFTDGVDTNCEVVPLYKPESFKSENQVEAK